MDDKANALVIDLWGGPADGDTQLCKGKPAIPGSDIMQGGIPHVIFRVAPSEVGLMRVVYLFNPYVGRYEYETQEKFA